MPPNPSSGTSPVRRKRAVKRKPAPSPLTSFVHSVVHRAEHAASEAGKTVANVGRGVVETVEHPKRAQKAATKQRKTVKRIARKQHADRAAREATQQVLATARLLAAGENAHGRQVAINPFSFSTYASAHQGDPVGSFLGKHVAAPGLKVLAQTARPVHAIAGATDELVKGHSVGSALSAAGKGLIKNKPYSFSDVLKDAGVKNKTILSVGGFLGDVGLDPTTYVTFGAGSVTREAAAKAAYKAALKDGGEAVARKAAKAAYKAGSERAGLTIGARGKVPFGPRFSAKTSGAATAKLARKTGVRKATRAVRGSPLVQATGKALAPDFRPKGVPQEVHSAYLSSKRKAAASKRAEMHRAERRVVALHRAVSPEEGRALVHAREAGTTGSLSPRGQAAERMFGGEMDRIAQRERQAGILGGTREDYVPHVPVSDAKGNVGLKRRGRAAKNPHAMRRKEGTVASKNAALVAGEAPVTLSENPVELLAARATKSAAAVSDAHYLRDLATKVGRPVRKGEGIGQDEMAFAVGKDSLTSLEKSTRGRATGQIDTAAEARARAEGKTIIALPRPLADLEHMARTHVDQGDWARWYDRAMGGVKSSLTVLNIPAYDLRNLYGDLFNAYLAGTSTADVVKGFRLSAKHLGTTRAERRLAGAGAEHPLIRQARQDGVIDTGHAGGEMYERARATQKTGLKKPVGRLRIAGKSIGRPRPVEALRGVGNVRENAVRLATYQSALKKGMSRSEARDWVNKHHFDYTELTHAERNFRRIFPFYTFTARNTRLQISKLFKEPGKAATVQKALEEASKAAGFGSYADFASQLSEPQQRGLPIPISIGGKVFPLFAALPATDLNRLPLVNTAGGALAGGIKGKQLVKDLGEQLDLTGQNVNPLFKAVIELGANHSFFFGQPIYRSDTHPDAPGFVPAPTLLGVDLGTTTGPDRRTGKTISKWPAWLDYLARLSPQAGTVAQLGTPVTGSRGQTATTRLLSQGTGVRIGNPDTTQLKINALYEEQAHLQRQQRDLRDQGKAGTEDHRTPAYKRLSKRLTDVGHEIYKIDAATGSKDPLGTPPPKGRTSSNPLVSKYGTSDPATKRLVKKYGAGSGLDHLREKYGP